ncbi:MAG: hypothetical protein V1647_07080 [Pseudomonadota bacterium]
MKKLLLTAIISLMISPLCHSVNIESIDQIRTTIKNTFDGTYKDGSGTDFSAVFGLNSSCPNGGYGFIKTTSDVNYKQCDPLGDFLSKLLEGTYKKYQKEAAPVQQQQQNTTPPSKSGRPDPIRQEVEKRFPST